VSESSPASSRLRLLDLGFTLLFAPVWCPLLLLGMGAAALSQGLPVFYRAERLGPAVSHYIHELLPIRLLLDEAMLAGPPSGLPSESSH
jgi:hypothetical protein